MIKVKPLVSTDWPLLSKGSEGAVGWDLTAVNGPLTVRPGESVFIETGIALELPSNMEAQVRPRSGFSTKHSVVIPNSPGTVDPDYKGEIKVCLLNLGDKLVHIQRGQRIAQLVFNEVFIPTPETLMFTTHLSDSKRGKGGFGSTGE